MSIQDRIAEVLDQHDIWDERHDQGVQCSCERYGPWMSPDDHQRHRADMIAAELFPTITIPEQLDALPIGSTIRVQLGHVVTRWPTGWFSTGLAEPWPAGAFLPAQLIWTSEWSDK